MKMKNVHDGIFFNAGISFMVKAGQGLLFAGMIVAAASCNNNDDNDNQVTPQQVTSATDQDFVKKAGYSNSAEIDLGQLAVSRAQDDSVKKFAQFMINEHTLAQNDLKALGAAKQLSVPDTPDASHKALKQYLMNYTGKKFDSIYIHSQVLDHQQAKQDFQTEINQGQDQDIKNYATKYLPHIELHLNKATVIADSVDKNMK